ncbi:MAG TPA: hypothetical protein VI653_25705 [Steroidobacteraceae bacterium]
MSAPATRPAKPSATFVLCVESGYLEGQILLVLDSIRRFGGSLADAPVLVVTPRYGPSLTRATLRGLDRLGARHLYRDMRSHWDWYPYMNKGLAAQLAEEQVQTEQVLWLDSDVILVAEPTSLVLRPGEDFACCAVDKNAGTSGPDDPNEAYWLALAQHFGITLERLPWVQTEFDKLRVRMRLHSGVYAFRRGSGLGRRLAEDMESMLASRIAFSRTLPFPGDDVALAFSVTRLNLRWRLLPMSCNYEMTSDSMIYRPDEARSAQILHFHHTLGSAQGSEWFLRELQSFRPDVAEWLRTRVPLATKVGGLHRLMMRRLLRQRRDSRWAQHLRSCKITVGK